MRFLPFLVLLASCSSVYAPEEATPYAPPAYFRDWWADMEACSGQQGEFNQVRWYTTDEEPRQGHAGWWNSNHEIYLMREWATDALIVRHEMLHELTGDGHGPVFDTCGVR